MAKEVLSEVGEKLKTFNINLGVPLLSPERGYWIGVPPNPHVFFCTDLYLLQSEDRINRILSQLPYLAPPVIDAPPDVEGYEKGFLLKDVMVMLGHGLVLGQRENQWIFRGSKKPVSQTVRTYEQVAKEIGWPPLDVLVVCRPKNFVDQHQRARAHHLRWREAPYIFPDDEATIPGSVVITSRLIPGTGVVLLTHADQWIGTDWWLKYWSIHPRNSSIPQWAKLPT